MAPWNYIRNPDASFTGNWTTTVGNQVPDLIAVPNQPYARYSFSSTVAGVRGGYEGTFGRWRIGIYSASTGETAWFPNSGDQLNAGMWYTFGAEHAGLPLYLWNVPRADWPFICVGLWSNGVASGGNWDLRCWNA
jgi:hypothetical protein